MWRTAFLSLCIGFIFAAPPIQALATPMIPAEPPGPTSMRAVPVPTVVTQPLAPPTRHTKPATPAIDQSPASLWALILFGVVLAPAGYWLWRRTRQRPSRQQRALIRVKGYRLSPTGDTEAESIWSIDFFLENTGNTPAQKMLTSVAWSIFPSEIPDDLPFNIAAQKADVTTATPGQVIRASSDGLPLADLAAVLQGEHRLLAWGWTEYDDTFKRSPRHRMEFCYEIKIGQDFAGRGKEAITATPCHKHNNNDGECLFWPAKTA